MRSGGWTDVVTFVSVRGQYHFRTRAMPPKFGEFFRFIWTLFSKIGQSNITKRHSEALGGVVRRKKFRGAGAGLNANRVCRAENSDRPHLRRHDSGSGDSGIDP